MQASRSRRGTGAHSISQPWLEIAPGHLAHLVCSRLLQSMMQGQRMHRVCNACLHVLHSCTACNGCRSEGVAHCAHASDQGVDGDEICCLWPVWVVILQAPEGCNAQPTSHRPAVRCSNACVTRRLCDTPSSVSCGLRGCDPVLRSGCAACMRNTRPCAPSVLARLIFEASASGESSRLIRDASLSADLLIFAVPSCTHACIPRDCFAPVRAPVQCLCTFNGIGEALCGICIRMHAHMHACTLHLVRMRGLVRS